MKILSSQLNCVKYLLLTAHEIFVENLTQTFDVKLINQTS